MALLTCRVNLPQMYFAHAVDKLWIKLYGPVSGMGMCVYVREKGGQGWENDEDTDLQFWAQGRHCCPPE